MWRLNVKLEHLESCVEHKAFAVNENFAFEPSEILLLQLTKKKNVDPHGRIKYFMRFVSKELDRNNLTLKYWGTKFQYLVLCSEVTTIGPFSLEDVQKSKTSYSNAKTATRINPDDEQVVMDRLKNKAAPYIY